MACEEVDHELRYDSSPCSFSVKCTVNSKEYRDCVFV